MTPKKKAAGETDTTLKIQYFRSAIGSPDKHKRIIKGLGFKRLNQIVNRVDTPAVRGMVAQVPHLVRILKDKVAGSR
jgi:large subunit ribosomal protein L30